MSDDKDVMSSSVQLRNKKIGLLGYGAINKYVHRFLSGFENEFNVLKYSWVKDKTKFPTKINSEKLHEYIQKNSDHTLKEIRVAFSLPILLFLNA